MLGTLSSFKLLTRLTGGAYTFLVSLWPNIRHLLWKDEDDEKEKTYVEFLNLQPVIVRAMQNVWRGVSDIIGEDGANVLIPDISLLGYAPSSA